MPLWSCWTNFCMPCLKQKKSNWLLFLKYYFWTPISLHWSLSLTLMLWWLAKWSGDDANISPQFLLLIIELQNHVSHQLTMQILVFFLRWCWCKIKLGTHSSGDYCNLQVLVADINIGYEDIVNTQVYRISVCWFTLHHLSHSYCNSFSLALTCEHGNFLSLQVLAFNGTPVRNLKHLANMVETCDGQFLRFDLEYQQVNICVIFAVVWLRVKCRGRTAVMDWMGLSQWIL